MNLLCQAALSAPGACRQATQNRVTTAVVDACAATAHGRHATNVRSQGRNASGMARSSFGPKELTPTAMSIPLPAGDYPTNLMLPPLYHLPATSRARRPTSAGAFGSTGPAGRPRGGRDESAAAATAAAKATAAANPARF
ncbi:hypothetical protein FOC4_g10011796 [Fusarium odoratissimum]|uniref:Uncharacterized protein n=1 Tax=Fusarium oxysporum f. sp. cubense (strain race 4) TaxID=2502994 RepID=N1R6R6_FUSC4|nr:hypothetical protein FOC4_g10011796 [Fusarium odoratissimum]